MPINKLSGELYSENNYSAFNGDNFNITLANVKTTFGKNTDVSLGLGNVWTYEEGKHKNTPAIEAHLTYNFSDNFNSSARFRKFGKTNEYRVDFTGSYEINKHNSIYAGAQYSIANDGVLNHNAGAWLGYTFTLNNGVSLSAEFEQGVPLNNYETTPGRTIRSFSDSNKTINAVISIPIK